MPAFLAQDADTRAFCHANGELRKGEHVDEILRFAHFWEQRTGRYPAELIFDSKLTTYTNFDGLNRLEIHIGRDYKQAKSRHLFRDFVDATAAVTITGSEILVRYQERAHNPLLTAAGPGSTDVPIPWLGGRRLRLLFG